MKRLLVLFSVLLLCIGCSKAKPDSDAGSNESEAAYLLGEVNEGDVEMVSVLSFETPKEQTLIGGEVVEYEKYPANFYTTQGNSRCSATMIGDKVLVIAAHCVGNGRTATLTYKGVKAVGTCTHHPAYSSDSTADWALCGLDRSLEGLTNEKILLDQSKLAVGTVLTLTGFGCTQPGGSGGNDGKFRVGQAPITRLPKSDNDIVTKGKAALCYGDSGGSAYLYEANGDRWDVSVNSRGNIRDTSYLSSFTKQFAGWAQTWAEQKAVKICGMHADAVNCKGVTPPPPPPPPEPSVCRKTWDSVGKCLFEGEAKVHPEKCQDLYAGLFACLEEAMRVD